MQPAERLGYGGLSNTVGVWNRVLSFTEGEAFHFHFNKMDHQSQLHPGEWGSLFHLPALDTVGRGCRHDGGDGRSVEAAAPICSYCKRGDEPHSGGCDLEERTPLTSSPLVLPDE